MEISVGDAWLPCLLNPRRLNGRTSKGSRQKPPRGRKDDIFMLSFDVHSEPSEERSGRTPGREPFLVCVIVGVLNACINESLGLPKQWALSTITRIISSLKYGNSKYVYRWTTHKIRHLLAWITLQAW